VAGWTGDGTHGDASPVTLVITLDGPSGSGKSTVARAVATALGWRYVDTGATYRAATLAVLRARVALTDDAAITAVVQAVVDRDELRLGTTPTGGVWLAGEDVSALIRAADVTAAVSAVSAVPAVRTLMVEVQRAAIGRTGAVAEGRDVGSVVVPHAGLKVYLDADPLVRASRRAGDADAGVATALRDSDQLVAAVAADLRRRDLLDSSRAASPLQRIDDAVHLDASALSAQEVTAAVLQLARNAGLAP
jgi:cytidylate kinase